MGSHQAINVARHTQGLTGGLKAHMAPIPFTSPNKVLFVLFFLGDFFQNAKMLGVSRNLDPLHPIDVAMKA